MLMLMLLISDRLGNGEQRCGEVSKCSGTAEGRHLKR